MACCLSNEDRCIPHLDNVLPLNVVASVLLVGGRGHLFALPFIFVDFVPRVGGLGTKNVQDRIADKGERLRACHVQGGVELRVLRRMSSACPMPFKADGSGAVCTSLALCVETATWCRSQ